VRHCETTDAALWAQYVIDGFMTEDANTRASDQHGIGQSLQRRKFFTGYGRGAVFGAMGVEPKLQVTGHQTILSCMRVSID